MERKKLMREVKRESLARMEEAARTENDFAVVEEKWDKLDENWERKQRYHGFYTENIVIDYLVGKHGEILDIIFDSAEEMYQLIEDMDISKLVNELRPKPKDILYLSAVRLCTIQQMALIKGQTDRNILKMKTLMLTKLQESLSKKLLVRIENNRIITTSQRHFLERYVGGTYGN